MRKTSFVLGLIGGIIGIASNALLLFSGLNMKVTEADGSTVLTFACFGIIVSIMAIIGATIVESKKTLAGVFMVIGGVFNIPSSLYSISADSPLTFIFCIVVAILLLISGIMALATKGK